MAWGAARRRGGDDAPLLEGACVHGEVLFAHERTYGLVELDCVLHGVPARGDEALHGAPLHLTAVLPEDDRDAREVLNLLATWRRAGVPVWMAASWSQEPRWVVLHRGKQRVRLPLRVQPWE